MSDEEEPFIATVLFRAELSDPNVPYVEVPIQLPKLWHIYRAIHLGGFEEAREILEFFGLVMDPLLDAKVTDTQASFNEAWESFGEIFDLPGQQWKGETDLAISFCYYLLRQELINRTEAAELIQAIQEENPPEETPNAAEVDAFRKRVDRWAAKHNLPRPGQPRRRTIAA